MYVVINLKTRCDDCLHACDIATDFAIHTGIRLNASMIMCAPCCHKELRPQLHSPEVLQPMLQFGIHAGQQAEMLTDTLRALLLKAYGYETKVFEFVALEHTSKNKMILATKRKALQQPDPKIMQQIQALKAMYGIEKQSLNYYCKIRCQSKILAANVNRVWGLYVSGQTWTLGSITAGCQTDSGISVYC
jgi:hypothetical protein